MIEPGVLVFFKCPKNSWILGTVDQWDGTFASCKAKANAAHVVTKLKNESLFVAREDMINEDVNDLLQLTILHDATLLRTLQLRYMRDVIYTNIGAIVIALNPFNFKIPAYMDSMMPQYLAEGDRIEKNLPHSWAVAHNTFYEMRNDGENQCILVSGESGAGKTEASKIVMKYLAQVSCLRGADEQKKAAMEVGNKINSTSPILEAFGNGKTVRNDNSSRFGKFMRVKFDTRGFLNGAYITKYLLEKSRIVTAAANERLYHSFYLVVRGRDADPLGVKNEREFRTLGSGGCYNNKEFDTDKEYDEVTNAMKYIGIKDEDVRAVWSVVAGVLAMGNVDFVASGEGSNIVPATAPYTQHTSKLWGIDDTILCTELVTTTLTIQGKQIQKLLNPTNAMDCRDALVKGLYDNTFAYLVERCNAILDVPCEGPSNWIGLLDIFGFEDFETNSFEQLCINLANETLQNHYNSYIFEKDMAECKAEGVNISDITFPDNGPCMDLLMGKSGIMSMLDEECMLGQGSDDGFLNKVEQAKSSHAFFLRKKLTKNTFIVKHYAGDVSYTVTNFLDKNRDTLKDAFKLLLRSSSNSLIKTLLPEPTDNTKKVTVGGYFKSQLKDLMELINSTNPHWIRCVKPHPAKKPLMFDGVTTMNQLESSGVLGTVKIRKAGYPVRMKFEDFNARYLIIARAAGADGTGNANESAPCTKLRQFVKVPKGTVSPATPGFRTSVKEFFHRFDEDQSGTMETTELVQMMTVLGETCEKNQIAKLEREMDSDNSGFIDVDEFSASVCVMINRGYVITKPNSQNAAKKLTGREAAEAIIKASEVDVKLVQLGTTRVFLKSEGYIAIEKAKKQALSQSAKVVLGFAKAIYDIQVVKELVRSANQQLNNKLREAVLKIIDLQKAEEVAREALFEKHIRIIHTAAQSMIAEGADLFEKVRQEQELRRFKEQERKAREEAEKAERLRIKMERQALADKRKQEEDIRQREIEKAREAANAARHSRILGQVALLAKAADQTEEKLRNKLMEDIRKEEEKRLRIEAKRREVAERRAQHSSEEQRREAEVLKALAARQFEVDLQKAQTDIRKARAVEKKKLENELRRNTALVKEQETKLLENQWKLREAQSVQVRQEALAQARTLKQANAKALAHQSYLEREALRRKEALEKKLVVGNTHSAMASQARKRNDFSEKVADVSRMIARKSVIESAEMRKDGLAALEDLKIIAAQTEKILSPPKPTNMVKPMQVHFDVVNNIEDAVLKRVPEIDIVTHERLRGRDKYENIVIAKPQLTEDVPLYWKP
eukprot:PhF_6_TR36369/c0_g1_i1/m.53425/K10357/MYO5; myosin V